MVNRAGRLLYQMGTPSFESEPANHVGVMEALHVSVTDDGVGFEMPDRADALTDLGHFGLVGMRERAEPIGAHVTIQSAGGSGTTIELRLPL